MKLENQVCSLEQSKTLEYLGVNAQSQLFHVYPTMSSGWKVYADGMFNKNDDEIHAEIIQFDQTQYARYEQRSIQIIDAREPPPKISETPGFWKCKFCDHSPVCHLKTLPARNCRTCVNSGTVDGGRWVCNLKKVVLDEAAQLAACDNYNMNPSIKAAA